MPKVEAIVTLMIDRKIIEAECSLCHEIILAQTEKSGSIDNQESKLQEAVKLHARKRHSEAPRGF